MILLEVINLLCLQKGLFKLFVSCGKTLQTSQTLKVISINVSFHFNLNYNYFCCLSHVISYTDRFNQRKVQRLSRKGSENKNEYYNVTDDNTPCRYLSVKATKLDFIGLKLKR